MTRVKICGITNIKDALAAVSYGADEIGFHVGQVRGSRNIISKEKTAEIISQLPGSVVPVLVTTSSEPREIMRLAQETGVSAVQFHGDVSSDDVAFVKKEFPSFKMYKIIPVRDESAIIEARKYEKIADAVLLDTSSKETGQVGGTGKTHDWEVSRKIVGSISLPVILAGGLNPENVAEAINKVRPYMVDVNSGVSNPDGTRNLEKMKLFVERAKG